MAEHTPGPWIARGEWIVPAEHKDRSIGGSIYPKDDRDNYARVIATLSEDRHKRGSIEGNAKLIAAAPDMLDALRGFMDLTDGKTFLNWPRAGGKTAMTNALWKAAKAIAKAEGK